jgi:1,4-alpha-glucan branching enzyme
MGNTNSTNLHETEVPKINELLERDPYLKPYEGEIRRRYGCFLNYLGQIDEYESGLKLFTESYKRYGVHVDQHNNITVLEWVPGAKSVYLRGDFSKIIEIKIKKAL